MLTVRTGNTSPFGRKIRIAVQVLGLEREIAIAPASTLDPADPLRQQNPLGKVPVLLLDDGGGKILPQDPQRRFPALRLQALSDGIMDASILINYEARYRPPQNHEPKWLELQAGKVARALAALEAALPGIDTPPDVGQITLACALGYRDFRFPGSWRGAHPRLVAWLDTFAARVPAFAVTTPPPA
jgi:glutathione S-transferase